MLQSTSKLIMCVIINNFMQISAQQLWQRTEKTFANTKFDLDPNLPFNGYARITTEVPDTSQEKSHLSVKIQPATVTATPFLLQTPPVAHQPTHVKPKSSKSKSQQQQQQQHQNDRILVNQQAPRAKSYHTISIDSSKSIQTGIKNPGTGSDQLQATIRNQKSPKSIIHDGQANPAGKTSLQDAFKILPLQQGNPTPQVSIANPLPQNSPRLLSSSTATTSSIPDIAHPSIASGNAESRSAVPIRQISSNSLWFNDTLPSFDCSQDFQKIATEFQRKFPAQTARDIREKRLAEVIKQRLIDCDHKSKNNHWQNMIELLSKIKVSPSEEEGCSNGLVQERIACINLLSYTCQFIKHDYTFRLVPARVIIQEARIIEDGAAKCVKVIRLIKKHNQPKLI